MPLLGNPNGGSDGFLEKHGTLYVWSIDCIIMINTVCLVLCLRTLIIVSLDNNR